MDLARPFAISAKSELFQTVTKSPHWIAQHKLDGTRCLLTFNGQYLAESRHGNSLRLTEQPKLPPQTTLDGELVAGGFFAFDCLQICGDWIHSQPLEYRLSILEELAVLHVPQVQLKHRCIDEAIGLQSEGVVFKDLTKPYPWGQTTDWLKVRVR